VIPASWKAEAARTARSPTRRRVLYAAVAVVAVLLCLFPRPHLARVKLLPQGSNSGAGALISALGGGGVQNFAAVLGAQKTNYLVIGRSHDVQQDVVERLDLVDLWNSPDQAAAERKLGKKVDIELLTGGVLEVTARDTDPVFAQRLVEGFSAAIQARLAGLGQEQVRTKRAIVTARLEEANTALEVAERDLNAFRMQNNLPSPEAELGAAVSTRLTLDAQIRGKEVEIETARRFQTDNSMRVRTLVSELGALRRQRAEADQAGNGENALALSSQTAEYVRLYREQKFAETIMLVYRRFFEEVSVEALSAETTVQVIERPHIDPDRQFNLSGIALLLLVLLAAAFTEIYAPMTGLARRPRRPEPQDPR
jgi:hypothetical protein